MGLFRRSHHQRLEPTSHSSAEWLKEIDFRERLLDEILASDGMSTPVESVAFSDIVEAPVEVGEVKAPSYDGSENAKIARRIIEQTGVTTECAVKADRVVGTEGGFFVRESGAKFLGSGEIGDQSLSGYNTPQDERYKT